MVHNFFQNQNYNLFGKGSDIISKFDITVTFKGALQFKMLIFGLIFKFIFITYAYISVHCKKKMKLLRFFW